MTVAYLFVAGLAAHLIADWFLQNEWMALHKTSLRHPAAWVHSGIHTVAYCFVFPLWIALLLGLAHILIDTRLPLTYWRRWTRQTTDGPIMPVFAMWQDQALHILCIALVSLWIGTP